MEELEHGEPEYIKCERLAYWYLRLNGCLTIVNFVVHPECGPHQRTDVDVLAVRFPHRSELRGNPLVDADVFQTQGPPVLIIAEAKRGACALNGPWTNREEGNLEKVLDAVGVFPLSRVTDVATAVYDQGRYDGTEGNVWLLTFGEETDSSLSERYPGVVQLTWEGVLRFVYKRFRSNRKRKSSHQQWDQDGHYLWNAMVRAGSEDDFMNLIELRGG